LDRGVYRQNTFFCSPKTSQLKEYSQKIKKTHFVILGGGSNMLLTKDFEGLTLVIATKEFLLRENETVLSKFKLEKTGMNLSLWCLKQNYGGVENLALIPGSVGAAPIQNIGAYGVELKSVFKSCKVLNLIL